MIGIMKEKRKAQKLTQGELAQIVGVSQRAIASYESGDRRPSVDTAKRIGAELGFPWTKFYDGEQDGTE